MAAIWLAALLLGSGLAVSTGRGVQGKVINVVIILGCMGAGAGVGFAMGLGRGNLGRVPHAHAVRYHFWCSGGDGMRGERYIGDEGVSHRKSS